MKKTCAGAHVAEDAGEVELLLQHRAGGLLERHFQLLGDDGGERGFPESGRAVEQDVIHGLAALAGGLDADGEIFFELGLAGEILQAARAQPGFELILAFLSGSGDDARVGHRFSLPYQFQRAPEERLERSIRRPRRLWLCARRLRPPAARTPG